MTRLGRFKWFRWFCAILSTFCFISSFFIDEIFTVEFWFFLVWAVFAWYDVYKPMYSIHDYALKNAKKEVEKKENETAEP